VIAVVCAVATRAAAAGLPCEEERGRTGIALAAVEQGLAVGAVDEDSAAASAGLRVGDTVLQVNGTVPRACADYGRTVREAEHERKALLVLVRRGDADRRAMSNALHTVVAGFRALDALSEGDDTAATIA